MDEQGTQKGSPALAPLAYPTFRSIWGASLVSNLGAMIQIVAASWMMTSLTAQADMVALVQASTSLPIMLFSLAFGAIADNFDRRRVMISAQLFMLVVSTGLAICACSNWLTPWLLLGFTFLIGCGTALNNPSWQASVGDIVQRKDLAAAVALNSVNFNLTRSVGPAIGGVIVATVGVGAAFAANALSYIGLVVALWRWKPAVAVAALPRESLGAAMGAGLRYVAMSPNLEKVLLRAFIFGLSAISILALLPLVTRDLLQGDPLIYGLMLGCFGVGAICGAFLSTRLRQMMSSETIVRYAFAGFALCAACVGLSTNPFLTGMGLMLGGACWVLALALFNVTVQLSSPRWVVGRTLSIYQTATFGGMALGSWLWGSIAENHGTELALLISAGVLACGGAFGLVAALPKETSLNLDPLNRWRAPDVALDIKPRSGPILVVVEYIIKVDDTPEFLEAMAERSRMRRRNGARNWTLARDVENPTSWMESYHLPTWVEYHRHNQRTTYADADADERILALHSGSEPPRVHRMIERPTHWSSTLFATRHIFDPH